MFSGVERHASFCKRKHYFDERKHIFINHVANEFQRTRKVYKRFILNILGWPAYEKRDNLVRTCPPFLSTFRFTTFGGKYMSNLGMIKLWNELLDHVSIGCN
ncbi:hypothetical protein HanPI659440_Chr16g0634631 [Helianthus annuus]|nr:hypothetical protein HanPI659440_Chr16g0634631 [Helianthus annuus]